MRTGAYKRSYILRYIEEACAEARGLAKVGGAQPGELTALQFPLNGTYGISVVKLRSEARGILLGPVIVGGATFYAIFGTIHDGR